MANYSSQASIVLTVNGKQAQTMLSKLEKDAARLRKGMAAAAAAGDKVTLDKYRRELRRTEQLMDQLRGRAASVEKTLQRLDAASPRELRQALRQLTRELNSLERGSKAWEEHTGKIRRVKAELASVNAELTASQSRWQRWSAQLKEAAGSLVGLGAGLTGMVYAARSSVDAFMQMDQSMTDVQKFTGMTGEQVTELNEEFKRMDTRTSREQLNALASEAGRLGKQSKEDVLGFVRAADRINVALDDLGDDAVLQLSKLTGVFGIESQYGTEQALLRVGSVINDLSQSCSASAPYLAEFTARLGGVAAQAGMSIDQVAAFGAVMDSAGVNVEASSTALQQVIIRILREPAKYAEVAGLDVKRFSELVRTDMNAALIELVETLSKAGGMDVLAPMFADMGEKGANSVKALSLLAGQISDLRTRQQEAAEAFKEGTSVTAEFDRNNNNAAATMEKARKQIHETVISIGQQLYPAMLALMKAGAPLMSVLSGAVTLLVKFRGPVMMAVAALVAYKAAAAGVHLVQALHNAAVKTGTFIQTAYTAAVHLGKAAMLLLTGNIKGATVAFRAFSTAIKANPIGLLVAGVTAAVGVMTHFVSKSKEAREEQKRLRQEAEEAARQRAKEYAEWKASLTDVGAASARFATEEIGRLDSLYRAATNEALAKEERINKTRELMRTYPQYFGMFSEEIIMCGKAEKAYLQLKDAIMAKAKAEGIADLMKQNAAKEAEQTLKSRDLGRRTKELYDAYRKEEKEYQRLNRLAERNLKGGNIGKAGEYNKKAQAAKARRDKALKAYETTDDLWWDASRKAYDARNANERLAGEYARAWNEQQKYVDPTPHTPAATPTGSGGSTGSGTGFGGGGTDSSTTDPLQAEKDWKEKELAQNRIDFYRGEKSYIAYKDRINEIDVQYYAKLLENASVSGNERLKAEADMLEARKRMQEEHNTEVLKQNDEMSQKVVAIEQASYDDARRRITDNYLQGKIDKKTYDEALAMLEEHYLKRMVELTYSGTKERADAEKALEQYRLQQMERRRKEAEDIEKKHRERLSEIKKRFFGLNYSERRAEFEAAKALLEEQYAKELATVADNEKEKERIRKAYAKALKELEDELNGITPKASDGAEPSWLGETGDKIMKSFSLMASGITSIMEGVTSVIEAELQLQTAAVEKAYDSEARAAEGNAYRLRKAEKKKQKELAALRADAARKRFGMQVFQTVATTAQNAVQAYGNALQIGGLAGIILAPIAAAAAVAAGAIQIAVIKKQMQQNEAQGYRQGGFTRPGRPDEPAGVVHAGEWVASQRLVNDPRTRPLLEALDYAQRTNTIGSITAADVSRSVTAPMVLAAGQPAPPVVVQPAQPAVVVQQNAEYADAMRRLAERLEQPFVTVNTVTGDLGIKQAQDKYNRLMANKSPRRK